MSQPAPRTQRHLAAPLLGALAVFVVAAWFYYRDQEAVAQRIAGDRLTAIADTKIAQLTQWRQGLLDEASLIQSDTFSSTLAARFLASPTNQDLHAELTNRLSVWRRYNHYTRAVLIDCDLQPRLAQPSEDGWVGPLAASVASAALLSGKVLVSDLHRSTVSQKINLDIVVPLTAAQPGTPTQALGVLLLEMDPETFLYPNLQARPAGSRTAETLICRREGNELLYLSPLRHHTNAALELRFSIPKSQDLDAAQAVSDQTGVVTAKDYRGEPVLAVLQRVPDSPWFLVVKQDQAEIRAQERLAPWLIVLVAVLGWGALSLGVVFLTRRREYQFVQGELAEHKRTEAALKHSLSLLQATLQSTADGILVVNSAGKITHLNARFNELWQMPEALLVAGEDEPVLHYVANQMKDPAGFLAKVRELYQHGDADSSDVLELADGRVFERYSHPQWLERKLVGRVWCFRDITKQRHAEEHLRATRDYLENVLNYASAPIIVWDAQFRITRFNRAFERLVGRSAGEWLGQGLDLLFPETQRAASLARIRATASERLESVEILIQHRDGDVRTLLWNSANVYAADGRTLVATIAHGHDITAQKQAEETARRTEIRFQALVENAPDGVVLIGPDGGFKYVSSSSLRIMGYTPDAILGTSPASLTHPDDGGEVEARLKDLMTRPQGPVLMRYRFRHADGSWRWVESTFSNLLAEPSVAAIVINFRDITERKLAEEKLQQSEGRLRQAQAVGAIGDWELDVSTGQMVWSEEMFELFELDPAGGQPGFEAALQWFVPEDAEAVRQFTQRAVATGEGWEHDVRVRLPSGREVWHHGIGSAAADDRGRVARLHGTTQDVTARKQAELALLAEKRLSESVINSLPGIFYVVDQQGKLRNWNQNFARVSGYSSEEIARMSALDFFADSEKALIRQQIENLFATGSAWVEASLLARTGRSTRHVFTGVRLDLGVEPLLIGVGLDISEREHLTHELEKKNEELEHLLYAASHDLRAPLVNLEGFSSRLQKACHELERIVANAELPPAVRPGIVALTTSQIPRSLNFIRSSVVRMNALVGGLLQLSRLGQVPMRPQELDMNRLLEQTAATLAFQFQKATATLEIGSLPSCQADPLLLGQVFANLLDNALKYRDPARPLQVKVTGSEQAGQVVYCVADNGLGIPAESEARIWELFHRLDPAGSVPGDGLGLNLVRRILDRHRGRVWVESTVGEGSRFFVSLPAKAVAATA